MGGGGVMRAATKVAGITVINGGIRGGVGPTSAAARNSVRPAAVVNHSDQTGVLKMEQGVQRPAWDFAEDEMVVDKIGGVKTRRVVFGPAPSFEEAKEATSDLKDALDKVYLSSPKASESGESISSLQETKACITHESTVPKSAMQAFKLLKENPAAQTVVTSIACDPNVWKAVMQNPVLMDFMESEKLSANFEVYEPPTSPMSSVGSTEADEAGKPDPLMAFIEDVKVTVMDMVNSLSNFVQNLFADPVDAGKKPGSSEGTTRTLFAGGSFMALAMMVIMVVVMKRG